jgi:dihydrofolate reductase
MKLIVACTPSGGIGYKNRLPWNNIQGDLKRFKELTSNNTVIMGRNTWESLPKRPLPNRINIVVSSSDIDGITVVRRLPEDLNSAWLIGGAKLINSSWHLIDEIHLTRVNKEYTCDVFIDVNRIQKEFDLVEVQQYEDHTYEVWRRK